ncbi:MAG: phosphoribosylaminoimidazolesuccinocarboxamide synthase [Dehalococcoidia bacterium]
MNHSLVLQANLPNLFSRGKVRDSFDLGERLLIVATDRISAFDLVLPAGIPDKGSVLTQMSAFWFAKVNGVVPTHFIRLADGTEADELPYPLPQELVGRTMIVNKARPLDVECVVRGYIAGTAWKEYQATGKVCGIRLPRDLRESEALEDPIFTPSTKAEQGHDQNITYDQLVERVGPTAANVLKLRSLAVYRFAAAFAAEKGIIVADTKMEFGYVNEEIILIDELLTPDSSRFWPADQYKPGVAQPSYDKQPLRDWLDSQGWDHSPPAPELPAAVVQQTADRYRQAYRELTGADLPVT